MARRRRTESRSRLVAARKPLAMPDGDRFFSDADLLSAATIGDPIRVLPDVNVVKVGGQSFMDRGREAVLPLVDEIGQLAPAYKLIIGAGGGTRARHAYSIALELGLPTGVIAAIGGPTSLQNARMLQLLLAKHGGVFVSAENFDMLPLFLRVNCIPIMVGMPPYQQWEKPPVRGRLPAHRTDAGVYLTAEFLGARSCIFVKDEKGLYTEDPKKNPKAKFIPRITAEELVAQDFNDLIVERVVLDYMLQAVSVKEIQLINGLVPGNLTRALAGEHVGTIISASDN